MQKCGLADKKSPLAHFAPTAPAFLTESHKLNLSILEDQYLAPTPQL